MIYLAFSVLLVTNIFSAGFNVFQNMHRIIMPVHLEDDTLKSRTIPPSGIIEFNSLKELSLASRLMKIELEIYNGKIPVYILSNYSPSSLWTGRSADDYIHALLNPLSGSVSFSSGATRDFGKHNETRKLSAQYFASYRLLPVFDNWSLHPIHTDNVLLGLGLLHNNFSVTSDQKPGDKNLWFHTRLLCSMIRKNVPIFNWTELHNIFFGISYGGGVRTGGKGQMIFNCSRFLGVHLEKAFRVPMYSVGFSYQP